MVVRAFRSFFPPFGAVAFTLVVAGTVTSQARGDAPGQSALVEGLAALEASEYDKAEKALGAAAAGPHAPAALVGLAEVELRTGHPDESARNAARARTARSADGRVRDEASAVEAEALLRMGRRADALARLEAAEKDPNARRARVELGAEYEALGRRDDARRVLLKLIDDYNDGRIDKTDAVGLALVGKAAHLLGSARDANDAYRQAERASKHSVEILLYRAELFLDKYDPGHAEEVLTEALRTAPHDPRLHAKMARTRLEQEVDFDAADHEAAEALEIDPRNPEAFFVRAAVALWRRDFVRADDAIKQGLAASPGDLDLLSMRAVVRFLADDRRGFESARAALFAVAPGYAKFYEYFAEFGEWLTRYDDLVPVLRQATRDDPDDAKAWAGLGMTLLRMGDEEEGLSALRSAWQKDRFNVRVFNTLNLYEQTIPEHYETVDGSPFRIRYEKEEKPILSRYVPLLLADGFRSMSARYGFSPKTPITVELYASREQFSVRMVGLPVAPFEGVCFGRVIAAKSPKAVPVNWGVTLWHELGHVFALGLSRGRVPKWFTEGLSEYETLARRPEWKREQDPLLYAALASGRIPPLEHYNDIFMRAHSDIDVLLGYYASSQLSSFLVETYGMPRIASMLRLWGRGLPDDRVFSLGLGTEIAEVDRRFRSWLHARLARYDQQFVPNPFSPPLDRAEDQARAHPNDVQAQVELALAAYNQHDQAKARAVVRRVLEIDPLQPDARFLQAELAVRADRPKEAEEELRSMVREGSDGYTVRLLLAKLALHRHDPASAGANLAIAHQFDPQGEDAIRGLYGLAERAHRADDAIAWLRQLVAVDQDDREAYRTLLERLVERKSYAEAIKLGESALFVDVENADLHTLYAEALAATGEHRKAVFELDSALLCDLDSKHKAEVHALLGQEYASLHELSRARTERDEALKLDPENARARGLSLH